jgi:hypothetical protein
MAKMKRGKQRSTKYYTEDRATRTPLQTTKKPKQNKTNQINKQANKQANDQTSMLY